MRFLSRSALVLLLVAGSAVASHAHTFTYVAALTGLSGSSATGAASVTLDFDLSTLRVEIDFAGFTGTVTGANLHAPTAVPLVGTAGAATPSFVGFPLGVTGGTYDHTFDLNSISTFDPGFVTDSGGHFNAINRLDQSLHEHRAYLEIQTTVSPAGEARGFLVDAAAAEAPEPGSLALLALSSVPLIGMVVRRRSASH
jgi:hypothetical protein